MKFDISRFFKSVFLKKFGKSRVRYIVGSLYRDQTAFEKCVKAMINEKVTSEILYFIKVYSQLRSDSAKLYVLISESTPPTGVYGCAKI
jgi:hypothetical protein